MNHYKTLGFIMGKTLKCINNYNIKFLTLISNFTIFIVDNNNNPTDKQKIYHVLIIVSVFSPWQNTYITITAT